MSATHDRILAFLRSQGTRGATDNEMSEELGIALNTLRPRRVELVRKGLVAESSVGPAGASTRWAALKEPKRPARKPPTLAKAAAPFVAKARAAVEANPGCRDWMLVGLTLSLKDCRALVKAAGEK